MKVVFIEYQNRELRNELKYSINDLEYNYLKSRLKTIIDHDKNVNEKGEYHVRSLYFDDITNSSYNEKEYGVFQRKKYRIRIYNKNDDIIRLELKEKFGKYISKSSRKIDKDLYYGIIQNKINISNFKDDDFLLKFYLEIKMNNLRPAVIVDYVREPYIYKNGNVRITFDKKLQGVINTNDIFHTSPMVVSPKLDGNMILEVKYDDYLPEFIRRELRMSRHQIMAISKYTICRDLKNSIRWEEKII